MKHKKQNNKDLFKNWKQSTLMEVNGLCCTLNMPAAIERQHQNGAETIAGLPPYAPRPAFLVDEYPACPDSWMHGSAKASSYFVPILPERGMWLDFTRNSRHTHHVAALISVQGINPLTGRKSDPLRLEQYRAKCPVHEVDFQQDLYCPECKYKWHPQNYLASNNFSPFWIDGFRTEDGTVRQWWFTEEQCKGVAAQLIGDERVFAIGIAFYLSKEEKAKPAYTFYSTYYPVHTVIYPYPFWSSIGGYERLDYTGQRLGSHDAESFEVYASNCVDNQPKTWNRDLSSSPVYVTKKEVESDLLAIEIGAGAKIHQTLARDPENLDFWQKEPAGFIYINYCDVDTAWKIVQAGKRSDIEDGFLAGLEFKG